MKILLRIFRIIIALLLLPFCAGAVMALWQIVRSSGNINGIVFATLSGAIVWVLIYIFLPEPKWMYVLGHELTHAITSLFFGGKLKKINVRASGGHVLTTKANFVTTLAPYFFPLYVVIVVILFNIGNYFWNWHAYILVFYFLIGLTYAFHVTLTFSILKIKQPDIVEEGYIFSAVIIFLGNMLVLLIGIPLLTSRMSVSASMNLWIRHSFEIYQSVYLFSYFFLRHTSS